jgi:uncharacterized membrane protein YjjB (DUF3815 family)
MEVLALYEKGIWFGFAAIGFAVLFNVPARTLVIIWIMAALGGLTKVLMIYYLGVGPVFGSLCGASVVGILSIPAAHNKHAPPMVFAIPGVIPMVPGVFAYRTMLGLIKLAGDHVMVNSNEIIADMLNNGLKAMFIIMALAGGVAIPMLITRKESAKEMKLRRRHARIDLEVE